MVHRDYVLRLRRSASSSSLQTAGAQGSCRSCGCECHVKPSLEGTQGVAPSYADLLSEVWRLRRAGGVNSLGNGATEAWMPQGPGVAAGQHKLTRPPAAATVPTASPLVSSCERSHVIPEHMFDALASRGAAQRDGLYVLTRQDLQVVYADSPAALVLNVICMNGDYTADGHHLPVVSQYLGGIETHPVWCNDAGLDRLAARDLEEGKECLDMLLRTNLSMRRHVSRVVHEFISGSVSPVRFWHVFYGTNRPSELCQFWVLPCYYDDGTKVHRSLMYYMNLATDAHKKMDILLRDHMSYKHVPCKVSLVNKSGHIVAQNSASIAAFGFRAQDNTLREQYKLELFNYFDELFMDDPAACQEMLAKTSVAEAFHKRLHITSALFKSWLGMTGEVWHDVQISRLQDPVDMTDIYIVVQTDVTAAALAEHRLHRMRIQQQALLKEILPQQVVDRLLARIEQQAALDADPSLVLEGIETASVDSHLYLTSRDVQELATYHQQASILFADIKGFTTMCQEMHPAQVMDMLNQLYSVFDSMLEDYDVFKVETVGDAYMVACGLMGPADVDGKRKLGGYDPNHAAKLLGFAKAMLFACQAVRSPAGHPIEIRVGIHSGPCMSGVVGHRVPRFCLFGDTINTASRLESTGEPMRVQVSQAFRDLVPAETWELRQGGVFAKGKGVITSYFLKYDRTALPLTELASSTMSSESLASSGLFGGAILRPAPPPRTSDGGSRSLGSRHRLSQTSSLPCLVNGQASMSRTSIDGTSCSSPGYSAGRPSPATAASLHGLLQVKDPAVAAVAAAAAAAATSIDSNGRAVGGGSTHAVAAVAVDVPDLTACSDQLTAAELDLAVGLHSSSVNVRTTNALYGREPTGDLDDEGFVSSWEPRLSVEATTSSISANSWALVDGRSAKLSAPPPDVAATAATRSCSTDPVASAADQTAAAKGGDANRQLPSVSRPPGSPQRQTAGATLDDQSYSAQLQPAVAGGLRRSAFGSSWQGQPSGSGRRNSGGSTSSGQPPSPRGPLRTPDGISSHDGGVCVVCRGNGCLVPCSNCGAVQTEPYAADAYAQVTSQTTGSASGLLPKAITWPAARLRPPHHPSSSLLQPRDQAVAQLRPARSSSYGPTSSDQRWDVFCDSAAGFLSGAPTTVLSPGAAVAQLSAPAAAAAARARFGSDCAWRQRDTRDEPFTGFLDADEGSGPAALQRGASHPDMPRAPLASMLARSGGSSGGGATNFQSLLRALSGADSLCSSSSSLALSQTLSQPYTQPFPTAAAGPLQRNPMLLPQEPLLQRAPLARSGSDARRAGLDLPASAVAAAGGALLRTTSACLHQTHGARPHAPVPWPADAALARSTSDCVTGMGDWQRYCQIGGDWNGYSMEAGPAECNCRAAGVASPPALATPLNRASSKSPVEIAALAAAAAASVVSLAEHRRRRSGRSHTGSSTVVSPTQPPQQQEWPTAAADLGTGAAAANADSALNPNQL